MKKIKLRNSDKAMELEVLILNLVLQRRFEEAKKLAQKYSTPVGYEMMNYYKKFRKKYNEVKPKLAEKRKIELIEEEKEMCKKWGFHLENEK